MKATIVYFSLYGNTQKVAEAIGDALRPAGDVRLVEMTALTAADLQGVDLVVMGAPTHNMNLPEQARPALDALPRRALAGVACAAFDTSYDMSRWLRGLTAARRLDKRLRKLGGKRLVPPETFLIEHNHEGPLQAGEIERAQVWAEQILARAGKQAPTA